MWKALHIICDSIIAAIILLLMLFIISRGSSIQPYVVVSGSMEPEIPVGSVCFIATDFPYSLVEEGDVIAFSKGVVKITHRVKAVTEKGLETKGDANAHSDGITTNKKNYIGINLGSIPYLGYVIQYLQTAKGKIMALTVLIALFLVSELANQKGDTKIKEKEELI